MDERNDPLKDLDGVKKDIDTDEVELKGTDSGELGIMVQFEFALDTRKTVGVKEETITEIVHNQLARQFKEKCEYNNWYPTGNGPDYTIVEQDWKGLPERRRFEYVNKYRIPRKFCRVFRIVGFVVPSKHRAHAPVPTDQLKLDNK